MEQTIVNAKNFGFGLMRLPLLDASDTTAIDHETLSGMVDAFLGAGFTYFDTAAPYHNGHSETAFRECVAKRYPRDAYTVTDKLSFFLVHEADKLEGFFADQLARCGVEYFDYYLLHAMSRERFELAERIGALDFVAEKKAQGKIRHIGFSFHDSAEVLDEMLTKYPWMEIVQLQLNYIDWEDADIQSRTCYEVCVKHGKPVIVMEPVKGGLLASAAPEAEALLRAERPERSVASWAIRFAASLDNVVMVLSGMSTPDQVEDNLSYMRDFQPLTQPERDALDKAAAIIKSKESIACTACRYCVEGCPQKIAIPDYFKMMNNLSKFGPDSLGSVKQTYAFSLSGGKGKASACVQCGQCEGACPQHLPIIELLQKVAGTLE